MNGKDLLTKLGDIDQSYYAEAEGEGTSSAASPRILRKPLLVAALIAAAILLMGCAIAYVLSLKDMTLQEKPITIDRFSDDGSEYLGEEEVTQQILTLAGLKGTPGYQAAQEWYDYLEEYNSKPENEDDITGTRPKFPAEYDMYNLRSQEMKDALDKILHKYDLKPAGAEMPFRTPTQLLRALDMENVLLAGSGAEMQVLNANYYEKGNLDFEFDITIPGEGELLPEETWGGLYYRRKDCLIPDVTRLRDKDSWREWNYTTASGNNVLIARSPDAWDAWIFCDMVDCTASLRVEAIKEYYSDNSVSRVELSDRQLELLADAIDFSLKPELVDGYENLDYGAVGSGIVVNGYSVELKSAQTDGFAGHIILGITGPEGTHLMDPDIENYQISPGNWSDGFVTGVTSDAGHSYSGGVEEDGDGLPNTVDYKIKFDFQTEDGSPALTEDSVMNIYFENIWGKYWDYETTGFQEELIAEGVWSFDVSFEGSEIREIELITSPFYAKATTGWTLDGNDTAEEVQITSFKLRSMSVDLTSAVPGADFSIYNGEQMQVVMKDGEKIPIIVRGYFAPIDLDQVDYILFPDGTKLPVPDAAP